MKLETDGDQMEKDYWPLFIRDQFPSYEQFWLERVAPLTNRPRDLHFKTNSALTAEGKSQSDLCLAQLSYSTLRHLIRCFRTKEGLMNTVGPDKIDQQFDLLLEGMTRLVGAQDNSFELLERIKNIEKYGAFDEKSGEKARKEWKKDNGSPLKKIRGYRNSLVHGRLLPGIIDGSRLCLPAIDKEAKYLDWRIITDQENNPGLNKDDFLSVLVILQTAWDETVGYLENNWAGVLSR